MMADDDKDINPDAVEDLLEADWKEEDAEEDKELGREEQEDTF